MAKENVFTENLQGSVEEAVLIEMKIAKLKQRLEELEGMAIKTPEQAKEQKELEDEIARLSSGPKKEEKKKEKKPQKDQEQTEQVNTFDVKHASYDQLLARRETIKLELEVALASAVIDNKKIDELQNELLAIEAAIILLEKKQSKEEHDKNEDKKTETEEKAEVEQQQKDEKDLSDKQRQEKATTEDELKKAYYDAMVKYYATRESNADKLLKSSRLANTDGEYLQEIQAEDAMYRAREEYLKLGKSDPYAAEREALSQQAKRHEQGNRDLLAKKLAEHREAEKKLAWLQKARAEKEEDIFKATQAGATQEIIDKLYRELDELDFKAKNITQDMVKSSKTLDTAMQTLELRRSRRRELNLESREYDAQSSKEQANIRYAKDIEAKGRNNFEQANKLAAERVNLEVKRNEERYDEIKQQLKVLKEKEPTNFEKRLSLLEQLDDASQQLQASRETQRDARQGVQPDADEAVKQAEDAYKTKEERKENFIKETEALRAAAEAQEKAEGAQAIKDPTKAKEEKKDIVVASAFIAATVLGDEDDTLSENLGQAAQGAIVATCVIPELVDKVVNVNNPKEAQGYVKHAEAVEAAKEAREVEKAVDDRAEKA